MRKIIFVIVSLSVLLFACKTSKNAQEKNSNDSAEATYVIDDEGSVELKEEEIKVPEIKPVQKEQPRKYEKIVEEAPILVVTEDVVVQEDEDPAKGNYAFYVIMGSFSKMENALRYKDELTAKGFECVILNPESSKIRVASFYSDSEYDSRKKVQSIRLSDAAYKDVWLLKKK